MEKAQLRNILMKEGADLVGFSSCKEYFPEYTSAVTVGVSALKIYRLHRPDILEALNEFMDFINLKARQILSEEGYGSWGALFSQEESSRFQYVPHRELAVKAGLGVIGKSFLLITPQFGPRVQFTTILTTMPLLPDSPLDFDPCESCNRCVEECPTSALKDYFHEELCIKCYRCVLTCPVGRDFYEIQLYGSEEPNIWSTL